MRELGNVDLGIMFIQLNQLSNKLNQAIIVM